MDYASLAARYGGKTEAAPVDYAKLAAQFGGSPVAQATPSYDPAEGMSTFEKVADRKSTRLNSSHIQKSRMPSSA